jgi:hypothetical protein
MAEIFLPGLTEDSFHWYIMFAYIDPGSGSILLQFLIATVVGAAIYFRRLIANMIAAIKNKLFRRPQ